MLLFSRFQDLYYNGKLVNNIPILAKNSYLANSIEIKANLIINKHFIRNKKQLNNKKKEFQKIWTLDFYGFIISDLLKAVMVLSLGSGTNRSVINIAINAIKLMLIPVPRAVIETSGFNNLSVMLPNGFSASEINPTKKPPNEAPLAMEKIIEFADALSSVSYNSEDHTPNIPCNPNPSAIIMLVINSALEL